MQDKKTIGQSGDTMSRCQMHYLARGLSEPGGKLPIFDREGQQIGPETIDACVKAGWAEHWYRNPIKRDWIICKLTAKGRLAVSQHILPSVTPENSGLKDG